MRRPFCVYKEQSVSGLVWYAKSGLVWCAPFPGRKSKNYAVSRSLRVPVAGKSQCVKPGKKPSTASNCLIHLLCGEYLTKKVMYNILSSQT
jgi:hypothetical protein